MADQVDVQKRIAEIQEARAQKLAEIKAARDEQYLKDLEAIVPIEAEHGADRTSALETPSFMPGLPTLVLVKTPEPTEFKRYEQKVRKASDEKSATGAATASKELAECCVAYPDKDVYKTMLGSWPSLHNSIAIEAQRLGQASGKG